MLKLTSPAKRSAKEPAKELTKEEVAAYRDRLSNFARRLTSPVITLYAGEANTRYYVHETILCQLQFFRAALQGKFKEASQKTINMPEDDPEAIAALIEWLSIGTYTYDGNRRLQKATMELRAAPEEPSKSLLEGLFHLEVCVVASKYDCAELFARARHLFYLTSQEKVDNIDLLRLWRAQGSSSLEGFTLPCMNKPAFDTRTVRMWVTALFEEHRAELSSTIKQFPDLILDILENCAQESSNE